MSTPAPLADRLDWTKLKTPPYLLGTALVCWGFLSDHLLLGLAAGLVLEGHRWVRWRWALSDQDYVRVWNVCVTLFLIVAVFQIVGQDPGRWQVTRVFQTWMPILLLPMMWAQNFSSGQAVPFITFSLVARRKRVYDERAGRGLREPRRTNLSYFYFGVVLLSIGAVGRRAPDLAKLLDQSRPKTALGSVSIVYVMAIGLLAWALLAVIPRRARFAGLLALLCAAFLGHHVHLGLQLLHGIVENKTMEWITGKRSSSNSDDIRTSFGELGELKLSPKIHWRARHLEGPRPRLLTEALYHQYSGRMWFIDKDYRPIKSVPKAPNQDQWEIANVAWADSVGAMELRGHVSGTEQLLPRLDDAALIFDLEASALGKNLLGTLVAQPDYGSIKYSVHSGVPSGPRLEAPPIPTIELAVPKEGEPEVHRIAAAFQIDPDAPTRERIQAVTQFFADPANGFRYTRYLSSGGLGRFHDSGSHIDRFLRQDARRGHCEYYATAAVLLLRAVGIPARYAVGYVLDEKDPKTGEFLLRGTHRHAWARAWMEEESRWIDVDTTPVDWLAIEESSLTRLERFNDRWDLWMLSWNLWRRDENKGLLWTFLPLLLAGGLLIVVVLRLVRGLRRSHRVGTNELPNRARAAIQGVDSAWYDLESVLARRQWARPSSQSVAEWCRQLMTVNPRWRPELSAIVEAHYRFRFDPAAVPETDRAGLLQMVAKFRETLDREDRAEAARTASPAREGVFAD